MSFLKETSKLQDLPTLKHPLVQHPTPTKGIPKFTDDIQQLINSRQRKSFSVPPKRSSDDEMDESDNEEMERFRPRLKQRRRSRSVRFSPAPPEIFEYPSAPREATPKVPSAKPIPLPWHPT